MPQRRAILLTGATGFLGRHVLRELLLSGQPVAVLARATQKRFAPDRIADLVGLWSETLARNLPTPVVLSGELQVAGLGLGPGDRRWLASQCDTVIHAAANISFQPSAGEPWATNVEGTRHLLDLCR